MKKLLSMVLCLCLCCSLCAAGAWAAEGPEGTAAGLLEGCSDWAREEIEQAISLGFVPDELLDNYTSKITRAEFAKIALCFAAMQYNCDVEDFYTLYCAYYQNEAAQLGDFDDCHDYYVSMARATDLVQGVGSNRFEPDRPITREESAKLLENVYLAYSGALYRDAAESDEAADAEQEDPLNVFVDKDAMSDWARRSVAQIVEWGVMNGIEGGKFDPKGSYTREQCIATFVRLYRCAPESIGHAGISLCPYSPEELVTRLQNRFLYTETARIQNENYYVMCGYFAGTTQGNQLTLDVVYKAGGTHSLFQIASKFQRITSMAFGAQPEQLVINGYALDGATALTVTVDLNTGEIL